MFLLIDNYDSFTFNLVQAFQQLGADPVVVKNDRPELLDMAADGRLDRVCISPGPSNPGNAGYCLEFLNRLPHVVPVLGVCLGHQCLGHHAGAKVTRAGRIMHGKTSKVFHENEGLFEGLPSGMEVCRYHSLIVEPNGTKAFDVTATAGRGEIMGLKYRDRPWHGVQFHPESILTPDGPKLLKNFLNISGL
ncbi:anthranilate synthase component II [Desulfovibrio oxyclinae]|uniref:anthranilate synthase component II n=1 Tax=Desulfovibrio oxyclinae TaxID=63560 RepID=UPI00035EDB8E|nr:aminodeoxychorismate/anthranilate synthase component II [Desulfovibrio oxyclinae]